MSIDEKLKKEFGNNVFLSASNLLEEEKEVISVSPTVDLMLGGGIPSGSFMVVTGRYKLGKTSMCLHIAGKAQKKGFKVYYFNVEGRLKKRDILGIPGLDTSEEMFTIVGSHKDKILNAEDYLKILMSYIETKDKCVFIFDSFSQLCSAGRHAAEVGDRFRDDVPLMLASLTKRAANILPVRDNILIGITHIIANQGHGMSPWSESSGQKIQYAADIKVKATHATDYIVSDKQVGQIVHWECDTSAIGPPGAKTSSLLRYGEGIDEYYDLLATCIDIGIVNKGGSWLTMPNGEKVQGIEKGRNYLKDNPDTYKELTEKFAEIFK